MRLKTLILILSLPGCINLNPLPDETYSRTDKAAAALSAACTVADNVTTHAALDRGGRELNPILSEHPSSGAVTALGIVGWYVINVVAKNMPPEGRKWWLGILGGGQCAVAYRNHGVQR